MPVCGCLREGAPCCTIGYVGDLSTAQMWSRVVKVGYYQHGFNFSFEQNFKNGEVASLRNYLLKYLAKTFIESIAGWSPEELVFNSIAWNEGYRLFGCSRDLSTAIKRKKKDNSFYT